MLQKNDFCSLKDHLSRCNMAAFGTQSNITHIGGIEIRQNILQGTMTLKMV